MSPLPALITSLSLILYFGLTAKVGRARARYNIVPPQMSGDPNFERVLRVQQNTLEQMILFLPALWLFCLYLNPLWGSILGAIWLVGRVVYAWGYYVAAEKRFIGFGISSLATLALLLGGLVSIIWVLLNTPIQAPIA
jgi:uncharacterized membrane protein YecN with MAPEG domain